MKGSVTGDINLLLYQTPWQIFGGQYATAIAIPYLWMDVQGNVQVGPISRSAHDSTSGVSDIELFPLMLVWNQGDLKWGTNFAIHTSGRLANTGKNYWTFGHIEPQVVFLL